MNCRLRTFLSTFCICNKIFLQSTLHNNYNNVYKPDSEQGGEGEVDGQLSCIYETITTKILKKLKKFLFNFLNFQTKINFEKKNSQVKEKYH